MTTINNIKNKVENSKKYQKCIGVYNKIEGNSFLYSIIILGFIGTQVVKFVEKNISNSLESHIYIVIGFASIAFFLLYYFQYYKPKKILKSLSLTEDGFYKMLSFDYEPLNEYDYERLMSEYKNIHNPIIKSFIDNSPKNTLKNFMDIEENIKKFTDITRGLEITNNRYLRTGEIYVPEGYNTIKIKKEDLKLLAISNFYKKGVQRLTNSKKKMNMENLYKSVFIEK